MINAFSFDYSCKIPQNDFSHFASKSQEDFKFSNLIFTSDLEIGFLASRNGSSGHLLN